MNRVQWLYTIMIISSITYITRALPFIIFSGKRKLNSGIRRLGDILPFSIMGMLVVYALKDLSFTTSSQWVPETISIVAIFLIHKYKKNIFLSIATGTIIYMLLLQYIFI